MAAGDTIRPCFFCAYAWFWDRIGPPPWKYWRQFVDKGAMMTVL
jgi:hypothetical protein